ncbi:MAG: hypothetical protein KAV00_03345 [Phycisphaerae bacterium]|nr:hypothetical protein [Phycisphaerae bacterium]
MGSVRCRGDPLAGAAPIPAAACPDLSLSDAAASRCAANNPGTIEERRRAALARRLGRWRRDIDVAGRAWCMTYDSDHTTILCR